MRQSGKAGRERGAFRFFSKGRNFLLLFLSLSSKGNRELAPTYGILNPSPFKFVP